MVKQFDLVVVGGGAAGLFAASVANTLGAKTALVEKRSLGGDCTWFGCMPSKAFLKSAHVANLFHSVETYGLARNAAAMIDVAGVLAHVRAIIGEVASHETPEVFESKGITVLLGAAQFLDGNTLEVNGEKIKAKKVIICTGSHPVIPPIPGLSDLDYLTNETIFSLMSLPESLIVLGGGPIGVELSQGLVRLGVKVTIVEMMDRLLFREDHDVTPFLEKQLVKEGVVIKTGRKAVGFLKSEEGVVATLEDVEGTKETVTAQNVLVAVGRGANVDGLGLERAGVSFTKRGVTVNPYLQTTNENIFACGDVVGPYQFSHVAAYQASVCIRNALFKKIARRKVSYSNIAWATFTDPEVAHVGLTEEEAREKYRRLKVYTNSFAAADRATTDRLREGLVKVITNTRGHIVGAHIVGAQASELMQGFLVAKSLNIPLAKLAQVMFIYPTLSELTKKTAAQSLVEKGDNPLVKKILNILRVM